MVAVSRRVRVWIHRAIVLGATTLGVSTVFATRVLAQESAPGVWGRINDGTVSTSRAAWLDTWTALRPIVDIGRGLVRAPTPRGIGGPTSVVGAFTLGGAPGAIAHDLARLDSTRWGLVEVASVRERGDFHRPFEAASSQFVRANGTGWQPAGRRGYAIGSFTLDQQRLDPSSLTSRVTPYTSTPFVLADSVMPPMSRTRARVDGALGLRLGAWGVGASAGLDAREHNSIDFPLRRSGRLAAPAAAVGIERGVRPFSLRVGAFGRWSEPVETQVLSPTPLRTTYYAVHGIDNPIGYSLKDGSEMFARIQRRAMSAGATLSMRVAGTDAVVLWESGHQAEDQFLGPFSERRPTDTWRAAGTMMRAGLARVLGSHWSAQLVVARDALDGDAVRADLTGLALRVSEARTTAEGEVRWASTKGVRAVVHGGLARHDRDVVDFVAQSSAQIQRTVPFGSAEAMMRRRAWYGVIGASYAGGSAVGRIPPLAGQSANYLRIVAPALAYDVAATRSVGAWVRLGRHVRRTEIDLTVRGERTTPRAVDIARAQPAGARELLQLGVGVRP